MAMLVQTSLFKPVAKTQLYDDHEEIKDHIFNVNILCYYMKQIGSLIVVVYKSIYFQFNYPILQTTYQNNFSFSRENL